MCALLAHLKFGRWRMVAPPVRGVKAASGRPWRPWPPASRTCAAGSAQLSLRRWSRRRIRPSERPVGEGDEQRVVAGDRARDLGPAGPVERGRDRVGRAGQGPDDEQQAGLADLDRQVVEQLAQAVLAARLGLDQPRRQGVGQRPLAVDLDQAELGDVAADRRLGRLEAALAEGGGELLLGPDGALARRGPGSPAGGAASSPPSAHRSARQREDADDDDRREDEPVDRRRSPACWSAGSAAGRRSPRSPRRARRPSRRGAGRAGRGAGLAADELDRLVRAGRRRDRGRHQEAEPRRRLPVQPDEQAGRDADPGAADARDERERLGAADRRARAGTSSRRWSRSFAPWRSASHRIAAPMSSVTATRPADRTSASIVSSRIGPTITAGIVATTMSQARPGCGRRGTSGRGSWRTRPG